MVEAEKIKEIEDKIRDIINWIAVFEEEYNLPAEVVNELRTKLEEITTAIGNLD